MVKLVPNVDKLTQLLSTVVISFRIKVRETSPLQTAIFRSVLLVKQASTKY